MSSRFLKVALAALPLLLTACAHDAAPASPTREPNADPRGTAWALSALRGAPPVAGSSVTAEFGADGRLTGSSGCNRYGATYSLHGDSLTIEPGMGTMMACAPEIMAQEQAYLAALKDVRSYRARFDSLELKDASGATLAAFAVVSQNLDGTTWAITGYHDGADAVRSPLTGTEPGIGFTSDSATADAGCNPLTGPVRFGEGQITLGPLAAGRKMCAPDVMEQERALGVALQRATGYRIDGDLLRLTDGDTTLVTARRR